MVTQYKNSRAALGKNSGICKGQSNTGEQIQREMEGSSETHEPMTIQTTIGKQTKERQTTRVDYDKMTTGQQAEAERLWSSYLVVEDAQEPMVTTCDSKGKPTG